MQCISTQNISPVQFRELNFRKEYLARLLDGTNDLVTVSVQCTPNGSMGPCTQFYVQGWWWWKKIYFTDSVFNHGVKLLASDSISNIVGVRYLDKDLDDSTQTFFRMKIEVFRDP